MGRLHLHAFASLLGDGHLSPLRLDPGRGPLCRLPDSEWTDADRAPFADSVRAALLPVQRFGKRGRLALPAGGAANVAAAYAMGPRDVHSGSPVATTAPAWARIAPVSHCLRGNRDGLHHGHASRFEWQI